jgi:hypothetical protein
MRWLRLLLTMALLSGSALLAPSPVAAQPAPADVVRSAALRLVEASRTLSPSVADRLDAMLQGRGVGVSAPPQSAGQRTTGALLRMSGVSLIGLVLSLVVLVTALGPLEGVIKTVEADLSTAFWHGVLTQAIAIPLLAAVLLGLAVTVVGLLAVPIALMASTLAVAGVVTLGVIAVAAVLGRARSSGDAARSRAGLLRALIIGYAMLWLPWLAASLLVAVPGIGLGLRVVALATTWVVATVGIGAVVRSRGGRRIPDPVHVGTAIGAGAPAPDWSTPTPVSGIAAARLPSSKSLAD